MGPITRDPPGAITRTLTLPARAGPAFRCLMEILMTATSVDG
jgi:hypothetical protein